MWPTAIAVAQYFIVPYTKHSLHFSEVVLQVSMRCKLQDDHHWEGGGDTPKHLEDMWVVAVRDSLHRFNLVHEESSLMVAAAN